MDNRTMIQYFSWHLPNDGSHWINTANDAGHLARLGITDAWLPPAYKGEKGINEVGYGVYDLYDLGEFDQKGTIRTKYGTKEEYLHAIRSLQAQGIRVLADIVLNHRTGADYTEIVTATKYAAKDRKTPLLENKKIEAWTGFKFPGRQGRYSAFRWNKRHFTSVDWDQKTERRHKVYKLTDRSWSHDVSKEKGNYDHLMGADVDFSNIDVLRELIRWGIWYVYTTGVDGFRMDAVKHISRSHLDRWLSRLRVLTNQELYAVTEYWVDDTEELEQYLTDIHHSMDTFDVTLHYQFFRASTQANRADFDLRSIFDGSVLFRDPQHAVTFVDNHDTQPGQSLESWVEPWFKPLAYAIILLWDTGLPCVYHGDLYGIPAADIAPVAELEALLYARKEYAYGQLTAYFDYGNVVGWTREGRDSGGMAVVMSNGMDGWKDMRLGHPGQVFVDLLGKRSDQVVIGPDGVGRFTVNSGSVSVWIPKK